MGEGAIYPEKEKLISQLKIIHHRLNGDLDEQLGKLSDPDRDEILRLLTDKEDITYCTGGFHNRVNRVVSSLSFPNSFDQLLTMVRQGLVENIGYQYGGIHTANRFTRLANKKGYGVTVNLESDAYVNDPGIANLTDDQILKKLKSEFETRFTPLGLSVLLCEQLNGVLRKNKYNGLKKEHETYAARDAEQFFKIINDILNSGDENKNWYNSGDENKNWHNSVYFLIDENDCIRDINWFEIYRSILAKLENGWYFKQAPTVNMGAEWIEQKVLEAELDHIIAFCREQTSLLAQLKSNADTASDVQTPVLSQHNKSDKDKSIESLQRRYTDTQKEAAKIKTELSALIPPASNSNDTEDAKDEKKIFRQKLGAVAVKTYERLNDIDKINRQLEESPIIKNRATKKSIAKTLLKNARNFINNNLWLIFAVIFFSLGIACLATPVAPLGIHLISAGYLLTTFGATSLFFQLFKQNDNVTTSRKFFIFFTKKETPNAYHVFKEYKQRKKHRPAFDKIRDDIAHFWRSRNIKLVDDHKPDEAKKSKTVRKK